MLSNNMATSEEEGYNYNFDGTAANNCGPEAALDYFGSSRFSWTMGPNVGYITLSDANGTGSDGNYYSVMKMDNNDCGGANDYAHLQLAVPCTVRVSVKASSAGADLLINLNGTNGGYASTLDKTRNGIAADGNFHTYDFVFNEADKNNMLFTNGIFTDVEGISISYAWPGGTTFPASMIFNWIEVGDAVGTHADANSTASSQDAVFGSKFSVFPNPAQENLHVDLSSEPGLKTIKLLNANGMEVAQMTSSNAMETIQTETFQSGIYLLQISAEGNTYSKKVVLK
jgi:hypothetical protein